MPNRPSDPVQLEAKYLTGEHIDVTVVVDIKLGESGVLQGLDAGVDARVTAQLRQVYHSSSETVIHVCPVAGHDDTGLVEIVIVPPTTLITIL